MDSTAKILAQMDGGAFEKLCTPILRKIEPELANLIPSGLNIDDRPIKSLADGFCFISRTHFATVHVTTNSSNLKTKWLYAGNAESTPRGDLIKSIDQAREMHKSHPDYRFSIFLVYNNRVDDDLHIKVNESNTDEFITVKIIEQHQLVSFLDLDPEGQYIRKHFLGIDADRISESLLKEITKNNLVRYGQEIYLQETHLAALSFQNKVEILLQTSNTCINLLIGDSGFGKSTLCYSLIQSAIENDQISLRLKPIVIEKAVSLEDAILQQLISDHPKLFIQEKDIQILFRNSLVVIDDINKSDNSTAQLDKIISWHQAKEKGSITILCPVWPRNLDALDNKTKKQSKFTVVNLEPLSFYDCKKIIQQRISSALPKLTDQQIHSLIIDTGFDPLLLDFSLEQLSKAQHYTDNIASEAIKSHISDKVNQVHHLHQTPVYLINQSLNLLGKEMLKSRNLDPHLQDIQKWFGNESEEYRIVSQIAAHRQLFSFDEDGKCHFRHDRVRDYLLTLSTVDLFNDFTANEDVLNDPYFAEITGAALADIDIQKEIAEKLILSNPLAIYISLKFLQNISSEPKLKIISNVIQDWAISATAKSIPKTVSSAITNALVSFDVKQIDGLIKNLPDSSELHLAKFRNGIWQAGINFLSSIDYFYPEAPAYWWNSILAHVQAKHIEQIFEELCDFLITKISPAQIADTYTLVGFFKDHRFLPALNISWKENKSSKNYISYLWAVLNSFTKNDRDVVFDALSYWSDISDIEKSFPIEKSFNARTIDFQLRQINWDFSEEQLELLFDLSSIPSLHELLAWLFSHVNHPIALNIVLNQESKRDEHQHWNWQDDWDSRWDISKTKIRLSDLSLDYLLQEFSNTNSKPIRRYLAWRYWIGNVDLAIATKKMQSITSEKDPLFDRVVVWRASHHDQSVLTLLKQCIARASFFVKELRNIWNDEAKSFFEDWFVQKFNAPNDLTYSLELLALLDNEDACNLLTTHWEKIKWHDRAIETALFLSTPTTRKLADIEIKKLGFDTNKPMPDYYTRNLDGLYISEGDGLSNEQKKNLLSLGKKFDHFHWHYGNKLKDEKERLTREKLESLVPYLKLFNSLSLYHFAERSLQIGEPDLCYEKFYPILDKGMQSKIRLTTEDLKSKIIYKYRELEKEGKVGIDDWMENVEKFGVTNDMLAEALKSFCEDHHNSNAFFLVALILEHQGTRKNIDILNSFVLASEKQRANVEYWKRNTIFEIKRRTLY